MKTLAVLSNRAGSKFKGIFLGHSRLMRVRKGKGEIFVVSRLPNDGNFKVPRLASVDAIFCFNAAIILIPFWDCSVNLRWIDRGSGRKRKIGFAEYYPSYHPKQFAVIKLMVESKNIKPCGKKSFNQYKINFIEVKSVAIKALFSFWNLKNTYNTGWELCRR